MQLEEIKIQEHNGKFSVSSRTIAKFFNRRHSDVLRAIENNLKDISTEFKERNFALVDFIRKNAIGADVREKVYLLSRDGFSLTAMSFIGPEAMKWKVKFLEAFNEMEHIVFEEVPKLKEEIIFLTEKLLRYENRKFLPSRKGMITTPIYSEGLLGEMLIVSWEMKQKEDLTELEKLEANQIHILRTQKGLTDKLEKTSMKINSERRKKDAKAIKAISENK